MPTVAATKRVAIIRILVCARTIKQKRHPRKLKVEMMVNRGSGPPLGAVFGHFDVSGAKTTTAPAG
jgi:hypothetical protein